MLYVGTSIDLEQRLDDHVSGQACRTTALDVPLALLRGEIYSTFSETRQREAQLKRWSRPKKKRLSAAISIACADPASPATKQPVTRRAFRQSAKRCESLPSAN